MCGHGLLVSHYSDVLWFRVTVAWSNCVAPDWLFEVATQILISVFAYSLYHYLILSDLKVQLVDRLPDHSSTLDFSVNVNDCQRRPISDDCYSTMYNSFLVLFSHNRAFADNVTQSLLTVLFSCTSRCTAGHDQSCQPKTMLQGRM